jgi:hypothetical protein
MTITKIQKEPPAIVSLVDLQETEKKTSYQSQEDTKSILEGG